MTKRAGQPASYAAPKTIHLIEDDPELLPLLCDLLKDVFGPRVVVMGFKDPVAYLEKVHRDLEPLSPPDILVTDHQMPGLTGTHVAVAARADWRLPCIIYTGCADVCSSCGVQVIQKTYDGHKKLLAALSSIVHQEPSHTHAYHAPPPS